MRLLHTSDWHVGRSLHGEDLSDAVDHFLDWLVALVDERGVDAVLISGDVFDRAVPPVTAIHTLSRGLERLCERTTVILSPGNHDSATRLGFTAPFLDGRLRIVSDVSTIGVPVEVTGRDGVRVLVHAIPYLEPDLVRHTLADGVDSAGRPVDCGDRRGAAAEPHDGGLGVDRGDADEVSDAPVPPLGRSHQAVIAAALRRIGADLARRRASGDETPAVVMVHAFLTGAAPSESERDIRVGGVDNVGAGLFDTLGGEGPTETPIAYVAAGHLHRPQWVRGADVPVRYSGSPIAYSFSEAGDTKSVTLVDVDASGVVACEEVPVPTDRSLAVVRTTFDDLMSGSHDHLRDHYLQVTVTDPARPADLVARVRQRFPHALAVFHEGASAPTAAAASRSAATRAPSSVSSDFFTEVGGRALTEAETRLLEDVCVDVTRKGRE